MPHKKKLVQLKLSTLGYFEREFGADSATYKYLESLYKDKADIHGYTPCYIGRVPEGHISSAGLLVEVYSGVVLKSYPSSYGLYNQF